MNDAPKPLAERLESEQERMRSTAFMEAMTAACAMIAYADGDVSDEEREQFLASARSHPALAVFSTDDIMAEFALHERTFLRDRQSALMLAEDKIRPVAAYPGVAGRLLDECRKMIVADERVYPAEIGALHKIRTLLGIVDLRHMMASSRDERDPVTLDLRNLPD